MATPFHVIVDDVLDTRPRGLADYARALLPALVAATPSGIEAIGFLSAGTSNDAEVERLLPGLTALQHSVLPHQQLAAAWRRGLSAGLGGMVHSPSLLAPLGGRSDQTVVTVHDAVPWREPDTVDGRASWYRDMAKRADRFAAAVVAPSYAVAAALEEEGLFRDRVRVIPSAGTPGLDLPPDAAARRVAHGLPDTYIASAATLNPRKGLGALLRALHGLDVPLVLLGGPAFAGRTLAEGLADAGIPAGRVLVADAPAPADRAAVLAGAALFVEPSRLEGFGTDVLDAMTLGVPVITTDDPALVELVLDAAVVVPGGHGLRDAIAGLLKDEPARRRLGIAGQDRARAFSWRDAAERIWQLHADL
ncbi:glycosyltransferase [Pseudolysinimonas sp.]|uniref:glycosyltransferase n=1 Tax=Pseudolysinimonas sp. TaxID=2680009 RepID=UPI003F80E703